MASLNHPANLKYSKSDEWVRVEGENAVIGITDYAQDQLGDIVYIELPWDKSASIAHEAKFGDIEIGESNLRTHIAYQRRSGRGERGAERYAGTHQRPALQRWLDGDDQNE